MPAGLVCWINDYLADAYANIFLHYGDNKVGSWELSTLQKIASINDKYYFVIDLKESKIIDDLILSEATLSYDSGNVNIKFNVFEPLRETLKIRSLNINRLGSTFKLLPSAHKEAIRRAVEYGTVTYSKQKNIKHKICIITYANDSGGWFDYFYSHYHKQLGDSAYIYVVTPAPESFRNYSLAGVIGLAGAEYDDVSRSILFTGLASGLQAYYEWVIISDVDEFIIPDPRSKYQRIIDKIDQDSNDLNDINFSIGFDLIQVDGENDFDFTKSIFSQRRYAVPNSGMCKPHVSRSKVVFDIGFHYCQYPQKLPSPGSGFLMLHMKYACKKIRAEVEDIVIHTKYSDKRIREYSLSSVSSTRAHPGLKSAKIEDAVALSAWNWQYFSDLIASKTSYSDDKDLYIGANFVSDTIVDFNGI